MNYTITFDQAQLVLLNKALVELPFKEAAPLINHINKELSSPAEPDEESPQHKEPQ